MQQWLILNQLFVSCKSCSVYLHISATPKLYTQYIQNISATPQLYTVYIAYIGNTTAIYIYSIYIAYIGNATASVCVCVCIYIYIYIHISIITIIMIYNSNNVISSLFFSNLKHFIQTRQYTIYLAQLRILSDQHIPYIYRYMYIL